MTSIPSGNSVKKGSETTIPFSKADDGINDLCPQCGNNGFIWNPETNADICTSCGWDDRLTKVQFDKQIALHVLHFMQYKIMQRYRLDG